MKRKRLRTRSFEGRKNKRAKILMLHFKTCAIYWNGGKENTDCVKLTRVSRCLDVSFAISWPKLKSNYSRNLQFYLRFRSVALEDDIRTTRRARFAQE